MLNKKRGIVKKSIIILVVLFIIFSQSGCASRKIINGIEYDTYGLFDKGEKKNPDIHYKLVWGNVIWGALLVETIVAPIYFFGFSIWEPVGVINKENVIDQVH